MRCSRCVAHPTTKPPVANSNRKTDGRSMTPRRLCQLSSAVSFRQKTHYPALLPMTKLEAQLDSLPADVKQLLADSGFDAARLVSLAKPLQTGVAADNLVKGKITP